MKRARALQDLSRDHLKALLAAKRMREAEHSEQAVTAFLAFWEAERDHFRLEEEILLPHYAAATEIDRAAVARVLDEHLAIRRGAVRLRAPGTSLPELRELGRLLHDHVRFEERHLFPTIEQALDTEQLTRLESALADAHCS